ncbi:MAG TPA: FAD-dependent oxidoreductase [Burkholderiaceae bacterium]|nr:FAD-dependent oxidoreductase [Burkholderiaceae bacterium]
MNPGRRGLLVGAASMPFVSLAPLAGCSRAEAPRYRGGWVGANAERGHALRDRKAGGWPAPQLQRRAGAIVVGAGIAGLAAARALIGAGVDDVHVFELEDEAGGNSRGHTLGGMRCPLGAHYLPVPDQRAVEVVELLDAFGLRRTERGVAVYDEATLCHSPQERLHIGGFWRDGLLPPVDALPAAERAQTLAQYRRFAAAVASAGADGTFAIPTARSRWSAALDTLDAQTFAAWLDAQALTATALRWYLDYCCRDDYGAGSAQVSAWAGLHYFASRHGFHAPGDAPDERDPVLTWPEGNAWLARRLAEPLRERLHGGFTVWRVAEERDAVVVDGWNERAQRAERWRAAQVVLALPLFVAARVLESPPEALVQAAAAAPHAPWLVGNLQLDAALDERPGAPLSWDNVVYDAGAPNPTLGYVDAMHQSTRSIPGPTVLTTYWALGGDSPSQLAAQRARLLREPWSAWASAVVADLARVHPDLPAKLKRVDLMRYGHAMSVPVPGLRRSAALRALAAPQRRVQFAHADLSAYSVFEEALYHGARAGRAAAGGAAPT